MTIGLGATVSATWFGPVPSGAEVQFDHAWPSSGLYVMSKDTRGVESNWSEPLRVLVRP